MSCQGFDQQLYQYCGHGMIVISIIEKFMSYLLEIILKCMQILVLGTKSSEVDDRYCMIKIEKTSNKKLEEQTHKKKEIILHSLI